MEDVTPSVGYDAVFFFLNAGFLLLYGALAIIAQLWSAHRAAERISPQAYWAAR